MRAKYGESFKFCNIFSCSCNCPWDLSLSDNSSACCLILACVSIASSGSSKFILTSSQKSWRSLTTLSLIPPVLFFMISSFFSISLMTSFTRCCSTIRAFLSSLKRITPFHSASYSLTLLISYGILKRNTIINRQTKFVQCFHCTIFSCSKQYTFNLNYKQASSIGLSCFFISYYTFLYDIFPYSSFFKHKELPFTFFPCLIMIIIENYIITNTRGARNL